MRRQLTPVLVAIVLAACTIPAAPGAQRADAAPHDALHDAANAADSADASQAGSDAGNDAQAAGTDAELPFEPGDAPRNISFDTAKSLTPGERGVLQPVLSGSQVDYFAFVAEAGAIYAITTNRGQFTPDNTITLYDPARVRIAENDSGRLWPGDAIDARLVVRAQTSGTHYIVAEDRVTADAYFELEDAPLLYYRLTVLDAAAVPQIMEAVEFERAPTAVRFVDDVSTGIAYITLVGQLRDGQSDVFELRGRGRQVLVGHVLPSGRDGNGSSANYGNLRVLDTSDRVLAQIDHAQQLEHIHPPIGAGSYRLEVTGQGPPGDNGFYAIDLTLLGENTLEQAGDNDWSESAQPLVVEGGFRRRSNVLALLPPGDRDYFAFHASAGETLLVVCEGASAGSSVRNLTAAIEDSGGRTLVTTREELPLGLYAAGILAQATGTHFLRLTSDTPAGTTAEQAWARCAVQIDL